MVNVSEELLDKIARKGSKSRVVVDTMLDGMPHSRQELAERSGAPDSPNNAYRVIQNMRKHGIPVEEKHGDDGRSKVFQLDSGKSPRSEARVKADGSPISSVWYHGSVVEVEATAGTYVLTVNSERGTVTIKTPESEITLV